MSGGVGAAYISTLGCARNTVDSDELAGRLEQAGWSLVDNSDDADVTIVNTCGFVDAAKRESIDELLSAAGEGRRVVAVGCLAERYGEQLAASAPEVSAVLGFDDYAQISDRLADVVAGRPHQPHTPADRRRLLPITPTQRPAAADDVGIPGHLGGPQVVRRRLESGPVAPVKLASGCDRRCTFCAIPSFRGAFVSRHPDDVVTDVQWLVERGVREVVLVSENTTSYGKDLGDERLLEQLLPRLASVPGLERLRLSYLQPAELRPTLVEAIATTPKVTPYFDLSLQHASGPVLRRMRRYGDASQFLALLESIRRLVPHAGIRSNVIVGFPGETDEDVTTLRDFLSTAQLDAVGVFGYSDEDGTEAAQFGDKVDPDMVRHRVDLISGVADEVAAQRATDRIGEHIDVLVESVTSESAEGHAAHQGADDGSTTISGFALGVVPSVGEVVRAVVIGNEGVDLVARPAVTAR